MNLLQLRTLFRNTTGDTARPYLWKDEEIDEYANDAVEEACRRASLLVDSTSDIAQVSISAGDTYFEIDESVIYVRRAILNSTGRPLVPKVSRAMDEEVPNWDGAIASVPMVFVPDWETGKMALWPPTAADDMIRMTVIRTPTEDMVDDDDEPEIAKRFHRALLDWMLHLGFLKQDADTFDPKKASQHEERFTGEFGQPSAAIDEVFGSEQYYDVGYR
jgi:hypothetical protein